MSSTPTTDIVNAVLSPEALRSHMFHIWHAHTQWLHDFGFTRALDRHPTVKPPPTGHEVVDLLGEFIADTGLVNAHLGLTSSDVIDNARLMQLARALPHLEHALELFCIRLHEQLAVDEPAVGLTHWQPAAVLSWKFRVGAWLAPLKFAQRPAIYAKRFGGPVGDAASLKLIAQHAGTELASHPFDFEQLGLQNPCSIYPLQSSDHVCELQVVDWACRLAAQLHKIALDLRLLTSRGVLRLHRANDHAGSSSMPHKVNPYRWEKVCSVCRAVAATQHEVWEVAAHNSLERTLDTSWQLKNALTRSLTGLALALDTLMLEHVELDLQANRAEVARLRPQLSTDRDLTRQVLAGANRWDAYLLEVQLNHKNKS